MDPMHQFEVQPIIELPALAGIDTSFTNSSLWMVLAVGLSGMFMLMASSRTALVPGRLQLMGEMAYGFVANMIKENVGTEGMRFFPFIFSLFLFILFCNMLGMLPYSFTVTSHLIVTFALAAVVFVMVTAVGFIRHGIGFLKLFVPSGIPVVMVPLLVIIEVISYLTRPVSLSVRLFGNMMAGHTMLKIFGGFVVGLSSAGLVPLAIAPFALMVALTGLELLIAGLQAYVFTILTCIYLNEAIHMDH
ncbi:MAG: F0F1 ATP synthase subunit A [PS1 clade bacterium]|uniref:ATP synthase subunit a n=1 Tax=PS1 clade bacterium TaxID=2175152 RepID=A0A937HM18_9PROT|nr:F0F1 ATP synthase subunit A [PS1 clade bacterium]